MAEVEDLLKIPDFVKYHPELQRRGIDLIDPLKPYVVFRTDPRDATGFAVKILDPNTQEAVIVERFQGDNETSNHVIPAEIIPSPSDQPSLLLMPRLNRLFNIPFDDIPLGPFFSFVYQIAEGLEHLHRHRVAHLDICPDNLVVAHVPSPPFADKPIRLNKVYLIDFHTSRQFELPPGKQLAISLPYTQCDPPPGITHFDPYSWDIYCMGIMLEGILKAFYDRPQPYLMRWLVQWLIGNERGCRGICRCRPTARRVRQVFGILRGLAYASELLFSIPNVLRRSPVQPD